MTAIHSTPAAGESQPGQHPPWAIPGGPAGPGGMDEGPQGGPRPRWHHRWLLVITAGLALAVAAVGSIAWAAGGTQRPLTTAEIAARTDPALVDVVSTLGYEHATSAGTGLVLTSSGEVLTNNHVINGATNIEVTDVGNGRTYRAVVVGYDVRDDIAVLQLQRASGLKTVTLGDSSTVKIGDKVAGIGNAGGRGGLPSVAVGAVTALGQSVTVSDPSAGTSEHLTGLIRTSADIQAGDSGGPLVNDHGQVIGIDTAGPAGDQFTSAQGQTQAYAIAINKAVSIARQIESGRSSASVHIGATAFLGVGLLPSGSGGNGAGVAVVTVEPGSPAANAGLTAGDRIVSLGGHRIASQPDVRSVLGGYHPGGRVSVGWLDQAGAIHSATLVLATGPAA